MKNLKNLLETIILIGFIGLIIFTGVNLFIQSDLIGIV